MKECFISWLDLLDVEPVVYEATILSRLRKAGIPVRGILIFRGIDRGTFSCYDVLGGRQFFWRE